MEFMQLVPARSDRVLRWVVLVPGAVLAVLAFMFPVHWFVMLLYIHESRDLLGLISPRTLEMLLNAFFTPFIFIAAGSAIAPRYKLATGIVLALLLIPLYIWVITMVVADVQQGLYTASRWVRLGITGLLCAAGFAFGLRQAHKAQNELALSVSNHMGVRS